MLLSLTAFFIFYSYRGGDWKKSRHGEPFYVLFSSFKATNLFANGLKQTNLIGKSKKIFAPLIPLI
jgi:hypothetical protein